MAASYGDRKNCVWGIKKNIWENYLVPATIHEAWLVSSQILTMKNEKLVLDRGKTFIRGSF